MNKTVLLDVKDGIGYITINRPEALNALSSQVLKDLNEVLDVVETSTEIGVVIVTGAGEKSFVAGADIKEMDKMTPTQAFEYMTYANDTFSRLEHLRQPSIAAINGYALGGGMELALSTDIRLGHEKVLLGFPEVTLGIIPGFAGTQRMPRLIGISKAKEKWVKQAYSQGYTFLFYHDPYYALLKFNQDGSQVVSCLERLRPPVLPFTDKEDKRLVVAEETKLPITY